MRIKEYRKRSEQGESERKVRWRGQVRGQELRKERRKDIRRKRGRRGEAVVSKEHRMLYPQNVFTLKASLSLLSEQAPRRSNRTVLAVVTINRYALW
eukprot:399526-Hanusia_phi.AAC.1